MSRVLLAAVVTAGLAACAGREKRPELPAASAARVATAAPDASATPGAGEDTDTDRPGFEVAADGHVRACFYSVSGQIEHVPHTRVTCPVPRPVGRPPVGRPPRPSRPSPTPEARGRRGS